MAAPTFFFLIGYGRTHSLPVHWIGLGVFLTLLDSWNSDWRIFLSFGLFAPTNRTIIVTMIIVSLLVSSALFLILELDRPFDGVIQVSSAPMRNAISNLGR